MPAMRTASSQPSVTHPASYQATTVKASESRRGGVRRPRTESRCTRSSTFTFVGRLLVRYATTDCEGPRRGSDDQSSVHVNLLSDRALVSTGLTLIGNLQNRSSWHCQCIAVCRTGRAASPRDLPHLVPSSQMTTAASTAPSTSTQLSTNRRLIDKRHARPVSSNRDDCNT